MVFVIQKPKNTIGKPCYDLSPAKKFGSQDFIFDAWEQPGNTPVPAMQRIHAIMRLFNPETDYVLWAGGDPFALALVSAMLAERFGCYKFLRWERGPVDERRAGFYQPVELRTKINDRR